MAPTLLYQLGKAKFVEALHGIAEVFLCNLLQITLKRLVIFNPHGGIRFNSCKQEILQSSVMDKQFAATGIIVGAHLTVGP